MHAADRLARTCESELEHVRHVTYLALRLFDELQPLHKLEAEDRFWLHCAALLHDIGWIEGKKEHHKTSLRIILETPLLPFDNKQRLVVGSIARYHRKVLPNPSHDHFSALDPEEQDRVCVLASLLRIADGLDSTHERRVRNLTVKIKPKKVVLRCVLRIPVYDEFTYAEKKSDLFQQVFQKKLEIHGEIAP